MFHLSGLNILQSENNESCIVNKALHFFNTESEQISVDIKNFHLFNMERLIFEIPKEVI